jgi:Spy/CpxP family protein refolding chaperone
MRTRQVLAGLALGLGLAVPAAAQQARDATSAPPAEEMHRAGDDAAHRGHGPRGEFRGRLGHGEHGGAMAGWHRGGFHRDHHRHGRLLFGFVMRHRQELGLTPAQLESFQKLATDYRRDAIKRQADMKLARVDLGAMLRPDQANPGKAVDMTQAEAKVREIERARGDMMLSRLRAMEQGKALLTPEQRAKLVTLRHEGRGRAPRG